jgi:hypothetical protein
MYISVKISCSWPVVHLFDRSNDVAYSHVLNSV